jgi:prepilin-type N-terminal cleavage/methylation domain-containing protein
MMMVDKSRESGFTLIETLIVVAVIGILAAIAIPQMVAYRQKSFNTAALSDLKNLKVTLESFHSDKNHYPATAVGGETIPGGGSASTPGLVFSTSNNVQLWYETSLTAYLLDSWHLLGNKQYGADDKSSAVYVAKGIVPLQDSLSDHLSANYVWPAPWATL